MRPHAPLLACLTLLATAGLHGCGNDTASGGGDAGESGGPAGAAGSVAGAGGSAAGSAGSTAGVAGNTAGVAGSGGSAGVTASGAAGAGGRAGAPGVAGSGGRGGGAGGGSAGSGPGGGVAGSGGRGGGAGGGSAGRGGSAGAALPNLTIFIAGDSTVSTYTNSSLHQGGWGQFLAGYFTTKAKVDNRAIGGRTSRRFIEEGRLTDILDDARAGDYLFVQFGTNDSNKTATYDDGEPYYLAPDTDFKKYMQQYIDGAKAKAVIPVLVTPPPRNSCQSNGKTFNYSFGSYATAMYQLGQAGGVAVVDLGPMAVDYLDGKGDCGWASDNFFLIRADGTVDGTHFQETGANILAGLVAMGVADLQLPLTGYLK